MWKSLSAKTAKKLGPVWQNIAAKDWQTFKKGSSTPKKTTILSQKRKETSRDENVCVKACVEMPQGSLQ